MYHQRCRRVCKTTQQARTTSFPRLASKTRVGGFRYVPSTHGTRGNICVTATASSRYIPSTSFAVADGGASDAPTVDGRKVSNTSKLIQKNTHTPTNHMHHFKSIPHAARSRSIPLSPPLHYSNAPPPPSYPRRA
ncbi:hypothetical protein SCHPADRAFT_754225 [Schizopora paradoxa]|uniref:Uncharacterized protein n=1 Tax=Schizopora paradoxa TaxID=27342 RepID=A0A0H2QZP4_9AGAM|nr:hypothetical protein SCHPADRAFT_754225 [Schizopora paradoxa]